MEQLINFIIRPPRAEYDPKNDLLNQEFMLKGKWFHRKDVEVKNSRGNILQCTHYMPIVCPEGKALPCVIYCHGNSGCRTDASEAAIILLPSNITVFTLDFSGSGLSGGEHVTLGWNEKDDLKSVVEFLRTDGNVSMIGLWGRSMGAVTSLMYGAEDPSIAGMVLDSPFSDLVDLMMELVDTYKIRLPKFTVKFAIQYMRRAIQKKAKFDIMDLNTIKVAKSSFVPVLFGHAVEDDFIQPHHSDRIFEAYVGDKNIIKFEGDHNSPRPQFYFDSINIFFHNVLQPPDDDLEGTFFGPSSDYYDRESWTTLHEVGFANNDFPTAPTDPAASSTEEAITQLRSRRPMSRTEVPSDITSNDKQGDSQDGSGNKSLSSSSNMISLEFSNGHFNGPSAPPTIDEDEYLEYSFDSLADFPSNAEEEERMLMEAMLESLKDLDLRNPGVEAQPPSTDTNSNEPSANGKTTKSSNDPATDHCMTTRADSGVQLLSPDTSASSTGASSNSNTTFSVASDCTGISSPVGNSTSKKGSTSVDMGNSTKATITVEKTPSGNILDGLMKFNFFRNNR